MKKLTLNLTLLISLLSFSACDSHTKTTISKSDYKSVCFRGISIKKINGSKFNNGVVYNRDNSGKLVMCHSRPEDYKFKTQCLSGLSIVRINGSKFSNGVLYERNTDDNIVKCK